MGDKTIITIWALILPIAAAVIFGFMYTSWKLELEESFQSCVATHKPSECRIKGEVNEP